MEQLMKYEKSTQIYIQSITEGVIYYAFINKTDPTYYQKNIVRKSPDALGFIHATDLSNFHITNENLTVIQCKVKKEGVAAIYVTNDNIKNVPDNAKKIIYSENGVDTLAVIYDLNRLTMNEELCIK
jgi:hypothetical protein